MQASVCFSLPGDEMSCRRSAVINISTLAASNEKLPENFHMAQMYAYRASKVLWTSTNSEFKQLHHVWGILNSIVIL